MKKRITILAAAIALGAAAIETSIAYQGVLRDALGNVLTAKSQTITFRLYSQPSGGTQVCRQRKPDVAVSGLLYDLYRKRTVEDRPGHGHIRQHRREP